MECPICNFKNNPSESIYCIECGAKLAESTPPTPQSTPQVQSPVEIQIPAPSSTVAPPAPSQSPVVVGPTHQLPDNSSILFGAAPQVVGRTELLNYLRTLQNIDPATISRQHFTIFQENGKYCIIDGKTVVQEKPSANHTYLNGVDITDKGQKDLKNGDVIDVANTVKLTFNIP